MRIALTHPYCWPEVRRGAERFLPALGAALVRRGHEVTHISSAWEPSEEVVDGVNTIKLIRYHEERYAHDNDFGRRVFRHLVSGTFDAVHSLSRPDAVASIYAARVRRGRRTVYTDLGLPDRAHWRRLGRKETQITNQVVRAIDVYSGMSHCAVDRLNQHYGRANGEVMPGGVDLDSFGPAPERAQKPTILFSGAFTVPFKEVPLLLQALPLVAREEPEVELWLSGPGDAEPLLEDAPPEARERTKALGLGEADRQHERYGQAWCTCLPSRYDSFGMVLIESLACGTPIVTTTEGAPQELVDPGVNGELTDPGDAEGLAAALVRGLQLARKPETVDACRASVERFDWDRGIAPLAERLYTDGRA